MIRAKLLLCAEGIVIDQRSNNVSAFEILEQLNPPSLPIVHPKMVVLSVLERDEGDPDKVPVTIRFSIAGSEIVNQIITHNFHDKKRSRNMFTVGGLPISQPGILEISMYRDDKKLMSYRVEVTAPKKATIKKLIAKNTTSKEATVKST